MVYIYRTLSSVSTTKRNKTAEKQNNFRTLVACASLYSTNGRSAVRAQITGRLLGLSDHDLTAVGDEGLAGDRAGLVRAQEDDRVGDVLSLDLTPEGGLIDVEGDDFRRL